MRSLTPTIDVDEFLKDVGRASRRGLLLDYDGTMAAFRARRDEARPHAAVARAAKAILQAGHTRVMFVSGRAIDDLRPLLSEITRSPEIWGSHGWEHRLPDGSRECPPVPEELRRALADARDGARSAGFLDRCEIKPASVAVHWRGLSDEEQRRLLERVRAGWTGLLDPRKGREAVAVANKPGLLEWHEFDGGVELRAPGRSKGDAVRAIAEELGPEAVLAYAGDDLTDEDAFTAMGDDGLSILVREQLRETRAKVWLESFEELAGFLTRWHQACTRGL